MYLKYLKPAILLHKCLLVLIVTVLFNNYSYAAVILQYHHVSNTTPRSTSLTVEEFLEHMEWLEHNQFSIIPLPELIERIKQGKLNNSDKVASITFDDTGESVCSTAAPILLERKWPFTIFINTEAMHGPRQCSWESLIILQQSELLTIGNHSHSHPHMMTRLAGEDTDKWKERIKSEIFQAQEIIEKNTGQHTTILAYPYGEYNRQIQDISNALGYTAVGQQSGAIGNSSDLTALPRFPLSGVYANIDNIANKLLSLPFPIKSETLIHCPEINSPEINSPKTDNPATDNSATNYPNCNNNSNAPLLKLEFTEAIDSPIQCFLGSGERIATKQTKTTVSTQYQLQLEQGRNRYNCTAASSSPGRFYWYSRQWVQ